MTQSKGKSVVLVTVDCLRADHVGWMGYPRATTPFLDKVAAESLMFPKAIVAGAPTYYALPGLQASRFPLGLGREVIGIAPGEPTLATVLQQSGFETGAFIAANPYLSARFGYEQGFRTFQDFNSGGPGAAEERNGWKREENGNARRLRTRMNDAISRMAHRWTALGKIYDEAYFQYCQKIGADSIESWQNLRSFPAADVIVDQCCAWLTSVGQAPFFAWLHVMDPHAPYYPKDTALGAMANHDLTPRRGRYVNETWKRAGMSARRMRRYKDEIVALYDSGIRWVDMQIARLAQFLQDRGAWDDCVFVVTADHGEEFLDHGGVFHSPANAHQEILHVPLLMRVPGFQARVSAEPFSHVHLAPTLLEALGIAIPDEFEGRSYWTEILKGDGWETAISESTAKCVNPLQAMNRMAGRIIAVQDEQYKLIIDFDRDREELYDLLVDPKEQRNISPDHEIKARARLLETAREHLARQRLSSKRTAAWRARIGEIAIEWSHSERVPEKLPS